MAFKLTKANRLSIIIAISFSFFCAEISVGFYTHSLALIADAFHYLNDLIGFGVALVSFKISERSSSPKELSFGWQRATLLGAFFNGVFLLALGVSIFLQSLERFISIERVNNPKLVLIIGCIGLTLNVISAAFLHEHDEDVKTAINGTEEGIELDSRPAENAHENHNHETAAFSTTQNKEHGHSHDAGLMGVLVHVIGDAFNNIGVIIAASIIWKVPSPHRFYADPATSMFIAFMILATSWKLVFKTGKILLESVPKGVDLDDVQQDLEKVPGIVSVHELHVWRLNQQKSIASAHIVVSDKRLPSFMDLAKTVSECFHAYGIHSATLQPELAVSRLSDTESVVEQEGLRHRSVPIPTCTINCGNSVCQSLTCCG